jgi:hypothetical protein
MDEAKLTHFRNRYTAMRPEDLAALSKDKASLEPEAAAALTEILGDESLISILPEAKKPSKNWESTTISLLGVACVSVFSKALAQSTPHWLGLLLILTGGGYWISIKFFRKQKEGKKA